MSITDGIPGHTEGVPGYTEDNIDKDVRPRDTLCVVVVEAGSHAVAQDDPELIIWHKHAHCSLLSVGVTGMRTTPG